MIIIVYEKFFNRVFGMDKTSGYNRIPSAREPRSREVMPVVAAMLVLGVFAAALSPNMTEDRIRRIRVYNEVKSLNEQVRVLSAKADAKKTKRREEIISWCEQSVCNRTFGAVCEHSPGNEGEKMRLVMQGAKEVAKAILDMDSTWHSFNPKTGKLERHYVTNAMKESEIFDQIHKYGRVLKEALSLRELGVTLEEAKAVADIFTINPGKYVDSKKEFLRWSLEEVVRECRSEKDPKSALVFTMEPLEPIQTKFTPSEVIISPKGVDEIEGKISVFS